MLFMVYTFRNLLGFIESAIMLRTSTLEINVLRSNFSNRDIGIINFEKYFLNFELISKYNVGLKMLLPDGLSEPEFSSNLVKKLI